MPKKSVTGEFEGHRFRVDNTWFGGAKLFHNDVCVAVNKDLFALNPKLAAMRHDVVIDGTLRPIEVFAFAIFTVKLKIVVDGQAIAGDAF